MCKIASSRRPPKLPTEVVEPGGLGAHTLLRLSWRSSPFFAPDGTHDALFLSNYISINVKDAVTRIKGVSEAYIFGALDYSMRIWMDPRAADRSRHDGR